MVSQIEELRRKIAMLEKEGRGETPLLQGLRAQLSHAERLAEDGIWGLLWQPCAPDRPRHGDDDEVQR